MSVPKRKHLETAVGVGILNRISPQLLLTLFGNKVIFDAVLHIKSKYWIEGYAISMYSRGYDFLSGQDFTELGEAIYKFKYYKNLAIQDRDRIQDLCVRSLKRAIGEKFGENLPFNFVVAVPANRLNSHSLPPLIAKDIAGRSAGALLEVGKSLVKQKEIPVLKNLDNDEKSRALLDAYIFKPTLPEPKKGILIIDDIYDSGATLRSVARAINATYPDLPKYVMTLTALKGNY